MNFQRITLIALMLVSYLIPAANIDLCSDHDDESSHHHEEASTNEGPQLLHVCHVVAQDLPVFTAKDPRSNLDQEVDFVASVFVVNNIFVLENSNYQNFFSHQDIPLLTNHYLHRDPILNI